MSEKRRGASWNEEQKQIQKRSLKTSFKTALGSTPRVIISHLLIPIQSRPVHQSLKQLSTLTGRSVQPGTGQGVTWFW